ncbi:MAG: hypothetical protein JWO05_797 [Gemmatimonadetes bacterium]|nr:hypothetical protein [Gemmatimonadota bacterium]
MSAVPVTLYTIGYEGTTVPAFLSTLTDAGIELLVDVRAVASSRRPGFAKTALTANVATIGVGYIHLRGLGTPADGRAAARRGRHEEMHRIFAEHMQTLAAQEDLEELLELLGSGKRVCILCFEAEPRECHRTLVAEAVRARMAVSVVDLRPQLTAAD